MQTKADSKARGRPNGKRGKSQLATTEFQPEHGGNGSDVKTITEQEFCKQVGISVSTALALRKAGKLAHCRVGRRVLYIFPRHISEFLTQVERKPSRKAKAA